MKTIKYSISCDGLGDGKSVCLWRWEHSAMEKIAIFSNEESARRFAKEFGFPLSEKVKKRLYGGDDGR